MTSWLLGQCSTTEHTSQAQVAFLKTAPRGGERDLPKVAFSRLTQSVMGGCDYDEHSGLGERLLWSQGRDTAKLHG